MESFKAVLTPNPVLPANLIKIDPEKCIACYQCAGICRCNVIVENPEKGKPPLVVYPDECWHCAVCTENCPTGAIEFEHPLAQKVTWKRKETGELFRIGMKNPPPPVTKRACGDRTVYLQGDETVQLTVAEITQLTRFVVYLKLEKTDRDIPAYRAGSFCNVRIGQDTHRGYSFANVHNGNYIELFIDTFGKGPGVTYLEKLHKGDPVEVSMPFGRLMYTPRETPLLLIGGVTGISPIRAILEQELLQEKSGRPIQMLVQVWEQEDVFLTDYFDRLASEYPNFTYQVFLAKPKPGTPQDAPSKLMQYMTETEFITPDTDVYICGSKPLIKHAERVLFDRNVFWRNIFYESFQQ